MGAVNRGLSSVVLIAPLLGIGLLAGHSLGYRWAVSDPHARAHLLGESGHSYYAYIPVGVAVAFTVVAASLATRVRSAIHGEPGTCSPRSLFALLPVAVFVAQELIERFLHTGHMHVAALGEPAVLIGLALQVPLALLALGLAWLLAEAADAIGRALSIPPRARVADLSLCFGGRRPLRPALSVASCGWSERGPPSSSC